MRRRSFLTTTAAATLMPTELAALSPSMPSPKAIAARVRDEFLHAWHGYKYIAWGYDEYRPLAGKPSNFFLKNHSSSITRTSRSSAHAIGCARRNCRTSNGYTVLTDVRSRPMTQGDYFPAYSFSDLTYSVSSAERAAAFMLPSFTPPR